MFWRFIDTGYNEPAFNMAVDEALMQLSDAPVLRVYGWQPYSVSIGYAQKMDNEIDPQLCETLGYGFVRRPTGGRAVFHSEEITYSVVAKQELAIMGNSIFDSYKTIAQGLANALWHLGIEAELQKSKVKEKES